MNKKTLAEIKQKLLQEKQSIIEGLSSISNKEGLEVGGSDIEFPDYGNEDGENAKEVTDWNDNMAIEKNLDKSLKDIDNALEMIEKGGYGVCKYCKKPIDEQRLLARPSSSSCVRCKEKLTGTL